MAGPKTSLEHCKALVSVVESGGYAQAAERIHKSQSTLSYSIQKLERLLGVKVFEIEGRKARLTDSGHILYTRGKALVAEAEKIERAAAALAAGWEAELRLAVEMGCRFAVDTDAHAPAQLEWLSYGCERAVECEVAPERVVNTWSADELLAWTAPASA